MKKFNIVSNLTRAFYKTGFKVKKNSPEILVIAGVAATIGGTIAACVATSKLGDVNEKNKADIEAARKLKGCDNTEGVVEANPRKALAGAYLRSGARIVKLYGPAVALSVAGYGCIFKSHNIIRKRNLALAAAYASIDNSFKKYRKNVIDRFGEELDKELRYDVKAKEVEETVVDENGNAKIVKKTVQVAEHEEPSDFCRCFDVGCIGWTKDPERNMSFLKLQQSVANERLQRRGYLFLNEVYDMFGFPHSTAGQIVGWLYRPNDPTYTGDGFVSFNIYDINKQANKDFVNGKERSIWIDFNVDGPIHNMLDGIEN